MKVYSYACAACQAPIEVQDPNALAACPCGNGSFALLGVRIEADPAPEA